LVPTALIFSSASSLNRAVRFQRVRQILGPCDPFINNLERLAPCEIRRTFDYGEHTRIARTEAINPE